MEFLQSRELEAYIENHTSPEDAVLSELRRQTFLKTVYPRMISGPVQGKLLEFLVRMIRPLKVLEIGTFTGYSAICMGRGLPEGGKILSVDVNDELKGLASSFINKADLSDKIELVNGNAIDILPKRTDAFDLIFIDGEKTEYPDYLKVCLPLLNPGGYILADNVLWDGKVLLDEDKTDESTRAVQKFNAAVKNNPNLEQIIIPVRDGLMLIRKQS